DALAKLEPGAKRTGLAIEIFGKSGAELLPVLDKLGAGGFDELRRKAEKFGVVWDENIVKAAERAEGAMKDLQAQVNGMMVRFEHGFLPELEKLANRISQELSKGGTDGFKTIGKNLGYIAQGILGVFLTVGKTIKLILEESGRAALWTLDKLGDVATL